MSTVHSLIRIKIWQQREVQIKLISLVWNRDTKYGQNLINIIKKIWRFTDVFCLTITDEIATFHNNESCFIKQIIIVNQVEFCYSWLQ